MDFKRIDDAIAICAKHLDDTNSRNTEIESFLVSHLAVIIIAEFELKLEAILNKRAERANDPHIQSFMRVAIDRLTRSIDVGEISGVLKHFGGNCKTTFQTEMAKVPTAVTYYGLIVGNRHDVAHKSGTNVTFAELEKAYKESICVFDGVAQSLGLSADEIKAIL